MTLSRAHTSADAADVTLLMSNKLQVTHVYHPRGVCLGPTLTVTVTVTVTLVTHVYHPRGVCLGPTLTVTVTVTLT